MAFSEWKIVKRIGRGGQGQTSQVVHVETGQDGVIKILHAKGHKQAKARARMLREVTNLRIVKSQGGRVPEVLDDNSMDLSSDSEPFFVMSLIRGVSLDAFITKKGNLSLNDAATIIDSLAQTIMIAHENDISHRDIKPKNIMIENDNPSHAILLDFGLSFTDGDSDETDIGEQVGNRFLSLPEGQVYGRNNRDLRSDVTQLVGIFLYLLNGGIEPRILQDQNGSPPHRRMETAPNIEKDDHRRQALEAFFDRGFAQQLDSRFQSINELMDRLKYILSLSSLSEPINIEELAQQASLNLVSINPKIQKEIYLAKAREKVQIICSRTLSKFGRRKNLHDFIITIRLSNSPVRTNPPLENSLDWHYLMVDINYKYSTGHSYAIRYSFTCKAGSEIGIVKRSLFSGQDKTPLWSSPIIWFSEPTSEVSEQLERDIENEIALGIRALSDKLAN